MVVTGFGCDNRQSSFAFRVCTPMQIPMLCESSCAVKETKVHFQSYSTVSFLFKSCSKSKRRRRRKHLPEEEINRTPSARETEIHRKSNVPLSGRSILTSKRTGLLGHRLGLQGGRDLWHPLHQPRRPLLLPDKPTVFDHKKGKLLKFLGQGCLSHHRNNW